MFQASVLSRPDRGRLNADPVDDTDAPLYEGRVVPASETLRRVEPFLPQVGITRVAQLTNLDVIGVPTWMAVRPNATTLSVSQGKGLDDDAARASAVMEAIELSIAETPNPDAIHATSTDLENSGCRIFDFKRFVKRGAAGSDVKATDRWLKGVDLESSARVFVPEELAGLADLRGQGTSPFIQNSDGLASGNTFTEALVHGLCERIERDALALWSFRSDNAVRARRVDPASFGSDALDRIAGRIEAVGLTLSLFNAMSDVAVPTHLAVIAPRSGSIVELEVASGSGCDTSPVRAALKAVLEAAQSRLTTISGARDDFDPGRYANALARDLEIYVDRTPVAPIAAEMTGGPTGLAPKVAWLLDRLKMRGIRSIVAVPMGGDQYGISVVKVLVPDLEDYPKEGNRRPGARALRAMMASR